MSRLSKKQKQEWVFFINQKTGRRTYKDLCLKCKKQLIQEVEENERKLSHNNVKVDIHFTAVGLFDITTEHQLIDTMKE